MDPSSWLHIADLMGENLLEMDPHAGYGKAPRFHLDTPRPSPYTETPAVDTATAERDDTVDVAQVRPEHLNVHAGQTSAPECAPTAPDVDLLATQQTSPDHERMNAMERSIDQMRGMLQLLLRQQSHAPPPELS
eukprot:5971284-Amphidinium_carterae.1